MEKTTDVSVREVSFKLMSYTRSLELCARMNYETENLDFIDLIKPGETLYDLGACEGRFSLYAALKGIHVFSFEPEQKNFKVLNENVALNNLNKGQINVFNVAVGDINHEGILKIGQPWEGVHQKVVEHGQIRQDLNFNFTDEQKIKIVSLDNFIAENKIPVADFMKIDIDGSEVPFIHGAAKTLSSSHLKGIIIELDKKDKMYGWIVDELKAMDFVLKSEHQVPNEPSLFNFIFLKP